MRLGLNKIVTPDLIISEVTDKNHGSCLKISVADNCLDGIKCIQSLFQEDDNPHHIVLLERFHSDIDDRTYKTYLVNRYMQVMELYKLICSEFFKRASIVELPKKYRCEWLKNTKSTEKQE